GAPASATTLMSPVVGPLRTAERAIQCGGFQGGVGGHVCKGGHKVASLCMLRSGGGQAPGLQGLMIWACQGAACAQIFRSVQGGGRFVQGSLKGHLACPCTGQG